jgi:APA family basic amino acid/polyamine antiporter
LFGAIGGKLLAAAVLVSALGSLAAVTVMTPRIYVALTRDGLFPRALGALHPRLATPARAIALQATLASLLVAIGTFDQIVSFFVFVTVAFVTASAAALFVLPRPEPGAFRAPARRAVTTVFVALCGALLVLLAVGRPVPILAATAIVALGLPVYALLRRGRERSA